ncbi:hypothetical protein ABK040_011770 [Willaertia magna]
MLNFKKPNFKDFPRTVLPRIHDQLATSTTNNGTTNNNSSNNNSLNANSSFDIKNRNKQQNINATVRMRDYSPMLMGANNNTTGMNNNNGHLRTRSFSNSTTNDMMNDKFYLGASFTPPDTFDLIDYELLLLQHKNNLSNRSNSPNTNSGSLGGSGLVKFVKSGNDIASMENLEGLNGNNGSSNNLSEESNSSQQQQQQQQDNNNGLSEVSSNNTNLENGETGEPQQEKNNTKKENYKNETSNNNLTVNTNVNNNGNTIHMVFQKSNVNHFKKGNNNTTLSHQDSSESLLTSELKPNKKKGNTTNINFQDSSLQRIPSVRYIPTFVPHKRGGVHKVNVPISSTLFANNNTNSYNSNNNTNGGNNSSHFTATDLIRKALELYRKETNLEPMAMDDKAYQLRVAEEDGLPDNSWPPLNKEKTMIEQLGNIKLVLVYDRDYKPSIHGHSNSNNSMDFINNNNFLNNLENNTLQQQQPIKLGGEEVFTKFNLEDIRLEVFLPPTNNQLQNLNSINSPTMGSTNNNNLQQQSQVNRMYQTSYSKVVPVSPELLVRDLQKIICQRFNLNIKKYTIKILGRDMNMKEINKNLKDKTLYSLGNLLERIVVVRNVPFENDPDILLNNTNYLNINTNIITNNNLSPTNANNNNNLNNNLNNNINNISNPLNSLIIPYDVPYDIVGDSIYHVVKTNKFGVRQDRILSFDAENIYNNKPSNSGFLGLSSGKTKHPVRAITSLNYVEWNPENPKCFVLGFEDEVLSYEARTTVEAHIIVKRLEYLKRIKNQEKMLKRRSLSARAMTELTNSSIIKTQKDKK